MRRNQVSESLQQYDAFRELWRKRGSLARAAAKYAQATGDHGFALQEMLREHYEWPLPGLWDALRVAPRGNDDFELAVRDALTAQRLQFLAGRRRPFQTLARLQQEVLEQIRTPRLGIPQDPAATMVSEAVYKHLVLLARMLVEQGAMREALHRLGADREADDMVVTSLRRASDIVLNELDLRLEGGMLLEDALVAEMLIESL